MGRVVSQLVSHSVISPLQRLHCEITRFELKENCVVLVLIGLLMLFFIYLNFNIDIISVCEHQDSSIPLPAEIQHSEAPHNTHNRHQRQSTSTNIHHRESRTNISSDSSWLLWWLQANAVKQHLLTATFQLQNRTKQSIR